MVEDDLIAARQADRSLSGIDFSRSVAVLVEFFWCSCHATGCIEAGVFVLQVADNGSSRISKFW